MGTLEASPSFSLADSGRLEQRRDFDNRAQGKRSQV